MTADEIERLVETELREFRYELPGPGTTIGVPWSPEKVAPHVERLRTFLVRPYLREFLLSDTYEQSVAPDKQLVRYWVVVETPTHNEFYDPSANNFGLGEPVGSDKVPCTIGVRGDLVGVFCSM
jgi:hypothetical protein